MIILIFMPVNHLTVQHKGFFVIFEQETNLFAGLFSINT